MALTDEQRRQLELRLHDERARLVRALDRSLDELSDESDRERSGDITALPFHPADQGTDTMIATWPGELPQTDTPESSVSSSG